MKATTNIEIAGKTYPVKFGVSVLRALSDQWGKNSFEEVLKELSSFGSDKNKDGISFDGLDKIVDLVMEGINRAAESKNNVPDRNDVLDEILFPEKLEPVMTALAESLPQVRPEDAKNKKKATPKKK